MTVCGSCFEALSYLKYVFPQQSWKRIAQVSSNSGVSGEFRQNEMRPYVINKNRANKMTVISAYTFILLSCCCPSREGFSFAGNSTDWLCLEKKSERTHSNPQICLKRTFYMKTIQFTARQSVPWAQSGFSMMKGKRSCARRAVGHFWLLYLLCKWIAWALSKAA